MKTVNPYIKIGTKIYCYDRCTKTLSEHCITYIKWYKHYIVINVDGHTYNVAQDEHFNEEYPINYVNNDTIFFNGLSEIWSTSKDRIAQYINDRIRIDIRDLKNRIAELEESFVEF